MRSLSETALPQELATPACDVLRGLGEPVPVIFSSPHSGSVYPDELRKKLQVPLIDLRRTEDAFVDELFARASQVGATLITANYARAFVDLNRDARELDPSMFSDGLPRQSGMPGARVQSGLGCFPRIGAGAREIYAAKLSRREGARRLDLVHDVYHQTISAELQRISETWPDAIMIDCHSMPSRQPGRRHVPDIVLGDRFGSSCSAKLTSLVEREFRRENLHVSRNAPYAGGYTTRRYGRPRSGIHVLQIEINRALYMDEVSVRKSAGFDDLKAKIDRIVDAIARFSASETL